MHRLAAWGALGAALLVTACSNPVDPLDAVGEWNGEGAHAVIDASSARFEFDCAHGRSDVPLLLDGDGRFRVDGVWVPEGGPVGEGTPREEFATVYHGRVDGDTMTLAVDILPLDVTAGPYTLQRGSAPFLRKCL